MVVGVNAVSVTVTAVDPVTSFRGSVAATLSRQNGFANVTVRLIAAGAIHGTVRQATRQASAGPGVKVDLFASSSLSTVLGTTFTDEAGAYRFPLVPLGNYTLDASTADGRRGRATETLTTSGQDPERDITFLGRGAVTGTVLNSSKEPVPGAVLTFSSSSIFGGVTINRNAEQDGTFRFDPVFVGNFNITARDPVTDRTASASGSIDQRRPGRPTESRAGVLRNHPRHGLSLRRDDAGAERDRYVARRGLEADRPGRQVQIPARAARQPHRHGERRGHAREGVLPLARCRHRVRSCHST